MLNKRYIKSIKRDIFCFDFLSSVLVSIFYCYILERKDEKWFKRNIIVLISFQILFVSISFLVNIGKEMPFRGSILYPFARLVWKLCPLYNSETIYEGYFH